MFVLAEMKDTVKVLPRLFNIKLNNAIAETLNKKFANKVCIFSYLLLCAFKYGIHINKNDVHNGK